MYFRVLQCDPGVAANEMYEMLFAPACETFHLWTRMFRGGRGDGQVITHVEPDTREYIGEPAPFISTVRGVYVMRSNARF